MLTIVEGIFEGKSFAGNTHLGVEEFYNRMVDNELKHKHKKEVENCLREIYTYNQAEIEIDSMFEAITSVTRAKFKDLFKGTLEPVEKARRNSKMDKSSLNNIVLVGGSTRIQKLLLDFFNGNELNKVNNNKGLIA